MARDEVSNFGSMSNFSEEGVSWKYKSLLGDDENELGNMLRNFEG